MSSIIAVSVKILKGKEAQFQVSETESVASFKQLIASEFSVPKQCQRLVFRGKTLLDSSKLCDYKIQNGAKVHLFVIEDTASRSSVATSTAAQSTTGLAMMASEAGAGGARNTSCAEEQMDCSTSQPVHASSTSAKRPREDSIVTEAYRGTKLWDSLGRVLQQHFPLEDMEKVRCQFFSNMHGNVNSLSIADLEEYAKISLQS